jgi:hypothetical protein
MSRKIIVIFVFAAGLAMGAGGFNFWQIRNQKTDLSLSSNEVGQKAVNFINKAVEKDNVTASLLNTIEESGVYKIHLKIADKEYDSFVSKDGKYLFSSAFNLEANQ